MWAATASLMRTICTNAGVPSCIRVPPLTGAASSGSPSRVARSIAATSRSADARPIDPARRVIESLEGEELADQELEMIVDLLADTLAAVLPS